MGRVLALDVAFTSIGWAMVENGNIVDFGCIKTKPSKKKKAIRVADDDMRRCSEISRSLIHIMKGTDIGGVVAEIPSGGAQSARASLLMGKGPAILAAMVEVFSLPLECVTPDDVKRITGKANASKKEVENVIIARWPDVQFPDVLNQREHIMDALGAYIAAEHGVLIRTLNKQ